MRRLRGCVTRSDCSLLKSVVQTVCRSPPHHHPLPQTLTDLDPDSTTSAYRMSLRKLVRFAFTRIHSLCSPGHEPIVKRHKESLENAIKDDVPTGEFIDTFLRNAHADVDRVEHELQAFLART